MRHMHRHPRHFSSVYAKEDAFCLALHDWLDQLYTFINEESEFELMRGSTLNTDQIESFASFRVDDEYRKLAASDRIKRKFLDLTVEDVFRLMINAKDFQELDQQIVASRAFLLQQKHRNIAERMIYLTGLDRCLSNVQLLDDGVIISIKNLYNVFNSETRDLEYLLRSARQMEKSIGCRDISEHVEALIQASCNFSYGTRYFTSRERTTKDRVWLDIQTASVELHVEKELFLKMIAYFEEHASRQYNLIRVVKAAGNEDSLIYCDKSSRERVTHWKEFLNRTNKLGNQSRV
jgi:hypothetical protein